MSHRLFLTQTIHKVVANPPTKTVIARIIAASSEPVIEPVFIVWDAVEYCFGPPSLGSCKIGNAGLILLISIEVIFLKKKEEIKIVLFLLNGVIQLTLEVLAYQQPNLF